jgi:M3 family oligoendopeptidase
MISAVITRFEDLPYRRVEFEALSQGLRRARLHLRLAMSAASAAQAVQDMQAQLRHYKTQATLARIRHDLRTDDAFYAAEQDYYDETDAKVTQQVQVFYSTLLNSVYRQDLEQQLGSLIFRKARNLREMIQNSVVTDIAEENRLATAYSQRMSAAVIEVDGKKRTLAELEPLQESASRMVRQNAQHALALWLQQQRPELDKIYGDMVTVRTRISRKLGMSTFSELGYKRMERFDIARGQVESLRQAVLRYIVPLTREIRRLQKHRLNLEHLLYFDLPCLFPEGNPKPQVSTAELPQATARIMAELTGRAPSFLHRMQEGGYLDIAPRAQKAQGGYCETLLEHTQPFILMNAGGTADDAMTLIHESGHAYASLRSLPGLPLLEYLDPTLETCEIHSTAMEYLSYPHLDQIFGEQADHVRLLHMTQALLFLPYGCMVDEFQHLVYDQPKLTAEQRHAAWRDLERLYQPDLDYGDEPFYRDVCAWMKKQHIFVAPFYYIDYVIAQLASLDIWQTARRSPSLAWQRYDKLCSLGGRDTFAGLISQAGLASPFELDTIKKVAYAAADFLDL